MSQLVKEIFGSTKIFKEKDGTYTVDTPIHIESGFTSYEDAYNYCVFIPAKFINIKK